MSVEWGFSTLAMPARPLVEVVAMAQRVGASTVELRCADDEPIRPGLNLTELAAARAELDGLPITTLATYARLSDADVVSVIERHAALAVALECPRLRIFAGEVALPDELLAERLVMSASAVEGSGVALLLETHDRHLSGASVDQVLRMAFPDGHRSHGAIWDPLHTARAGESVELSLAYLAAWLREVQLKDVASLTTLTPVVPGEGVVPVEATVRLAMAAGFTGAWVLEYEKRWHPAVDEFEAALLAVRDLLRRCTRARG